MSRRRSRWSRDELIERLRILGPLDTPLPPTLPPSPPASRSASPAVGSKRKPDTSSLQIHEQPKRHRTDAPSTSTHAPAPSSSTSHHPQHTHSHPAASTSADPSTSLGTTPAVARNNEPCEDGEVREDVQPPPAYPLENSVPIRRPRRGPPGVRTCEQNHSAYYARARMLKYSGDARHWSTFPTSNKEYKSLSNPPPPNSPYHKYGGLIARLELIDALVCFAYALWNKDRGRKHCNYENWETISSFLVWCKTKWEKEPGNIADDAEKAFVGLIWMLEGYIHARKLVYLSRQLVDRGLDTVVATTKQEIAAALHSAEQKTSSHGLNASGNPQMLPSPASIAPSSSTTSTPTTRDEKSPNPANARPPAPASNPIEDYPLIPTRLLPSNLRGAPAPTWAVEATKNIKQSIDVQMIGGLKDVTAALGAAGYATTQASRTLNLPILARHYPRTFARMIHSSLTPQEEYEPDFEDEEGELLWPGECINGEGLGWVCLMGQAMVREFGKRYGYQGIKGVVPKPSADEQRPSASSSSSHAISNSFPSSGGHSLPPRPNFPAGSR